MDRDENAAERRYLISEVIQQCKLAVAAESVNKSSERRQLTAAQSPNHALRYNWIFRHNYGPWQLDRTQPGIPSVHCFQRWTTSDLKLFLEHLESGELFVTAERPALSSEGEKSLAQRKDRPGTPNKRKGDDLFAESIRPFRKGVIVGPQWAKLKEKLCEVVEKTTGCPITIEAISAEDDISADRAWTLLKPLSQTFQDSLGFNWIYSGNYSAPKGSLPQWSEIDITACFTAIETGKLRATKVSSTNSMVQDSPNVEKRNNEDFFAGAAKHRQLLKDVHLIISRALIAMLNEIRNPKPHPRHWSVKPIITDDGSKGLPGYKWVFDDGGLFKEFPNKALAAWKSDDLQNFMDGMKMQTIVLKKSLKNKQHALSVQGVNTRMESGNSYLYIDTENEEFKDARLEMIPGTDTFTLSIAQEGSGTLAKGTVEGQTSDVHESHLGSFSSLELPDDNDGPDGDMQESLPRGLSDNITGLQAEHEKLGLKLKEIQGRLVKSFNEISQEYEKVHMKRSAVFDELSKKYSALEAKYTTIVDSHTKAVEKMRQWKEHALKMKQEHKVQLEIKIKMQEKAEGLANQFGTKLIQANTKIEALEKEATKVTGNQTSDRGVLQKRPHEEDDGASSGREKRQKDGRSPKS